MVLALGVPPRSSHHRPCRITSVLSSSARRPSARYGVRVRVRVGVGVGVGVRVTYLLIPHPHPHPSPSPTPTPDPRRSSRTSAYSPTGRPSWSPPRATRPPSATTSTRSASPPTSSASASPPARRSSAWATYRECAWTAHPSYYPRPVSVFVYCFWCASCTGLCVCGYHPAEHLQSAPSASRCRKAVCVG